MILSVSEIRESEKITMTNEPIASVDLMERAGTTFAEHLAKNQNLNLFDRIDIFCGPGNNGGDGLVIARHLAENGFPVLVITANSQSRTTAEFDVNLQRYCDLSNIQGLKNAEFEDFDNFKENGSTRGRILCIDALFGIGLSRPLEGKFAEVISFINKKYENIVAVDIPSGLYCDTHIQNNAPCIRARFTYTFQWMKWNFVLPEYQSVVGEISVLDIGLQKPKNCQGIAESEISVTKPAKAELRTADPFAHKGSYGHGLLVAGSQVMPGAAILSATAALRSGLGKLTVHTTPNVAAALPIALPEAIISQDCCPDCITEKIQLTDFQAIAIGPGIGKSNATRDFLEYLLTNAQVPMVIDADALNLLAENRHLLRKLPPFTILTPHVGEFERLAGECISDFERVTKLKDFSINHNVIVVLKGHDSIVSVPENGTAHLYINPTGNAGMATAGSGDVLTGIILGLLSRYKNPKSAATQGVYLHGAAGDAALAEQSYLSIIASDICKNIGKAIQKL